MRATEQKLYRYVGPAEIPQRVKNEPVLEPVTSLAELLKQVDALGFRRQDGFLLTVTFVIDAKGKLRIADRRSEHVVCAGHGDVASAGEMTFGWDAGGCVVENVTNQSTGYCPEAESWPAVDCTLNELAIPHPAAFDPAFIFRRCDSCRQTNLVKDGWFVCSMCGAGLPTNWNYC